jgi:hypothetical protein
MRPRRDHLADFSLWPEIVCRYLYRLVRNSLRIRTFVTGSNPVSRTI